MRGLALVFAVAAGTAQGQEFEFSTHAVESCIAAKTGAMQADRCIGESASACMVTNDGGMTTVGMGYCLEKEWLYWDARLNAAYQRAMAEARRSDAELEELDVSAPKQAPALRQMQLAWIAFRDAKCDHAGALWGGGTGGGPATLSCLMVTTGEQALYLENMMLGG